MKLFNIRGSSSPCSVARNLTKFRLNPPGSWICSNAGCGAWLGPAKDADRILAACLRWSVCHLYISWLMRSRSLKKVFLNTRMNGDLRHIRARRVVRYRKWFQIFLLAVGDAIGRTSRNRKGRPWWSWDTAVFKRLSFVNGFHTLFLGN